MHLRETVCTVLDYQPLRGSRELGAQRLHGPSRVGRRVLGRRRLLPVCFDAREEADRQEGCERVLHFEQSPALVLQVELGYPLQSSFDVQPGKHSFLPALFVVQRFGTPVRTLPQSASVVH